MADDNALLERIDERTSALKEGQGRQREELDALRADVADVKAKADAMFDDGNAGLKLFVEQRIRDALAERGLTNRDWIMLGLTAASVLFAYLTWKGSH